MALSVTCSWKILRLITWKASGTWSFGSSGRCWRSCVRLIIRCWSCWSCVSEGWVWMWGTSYRHLLCFIDSCPTRIRGWPRWLTCWLSSGERSRAWLWPWGTSAWRGRFSCLSCISCCAIGRACWRSWRSGSFSWPLLVLVMMSAGSGCHSLLWWSTNSEWRKFI